MLSSTKFAIRTLPATLEPVVALADPLVMPPVLEPLAEPVVGAIPPVDPLAEAALPLEAAELELAPEGAPLAPVAATEPDVEPVPTG
jgi:hypothetical protein